jgi:hypothetical protein
MREYGKVAPSFWMGETGREIIQSGPESTIVALYLMTSPHANMLGLYYLPIAYVSHDTGLPLEGASKGLQRVCEAGLCGYDKGAQVVWVYEMARYQVEDSLKPGDKRVVGINKEYQRLPKCSFLGVFFDKYHKAFHLENRRGSEAPCKPLRSQEQEQEQEQEQDYPTPTRARAFSDRFQMFQDWKPSEYFQTLAKTSGVVPPEGEHLQESMQEFVSFWLTQKRQRTVHEWDLAFVKAIKGGFVRPRNGQHQKAEYCGQLQPRNVREALIIQGEQIARALNDDDERRKQQRRVGPDGGQAGSLLLEHQI